MNTCQELGFFFHSKSQSAILKLTSDKTEPGLLLVKDILSKIKKIKKNNFKYFKPTKLSVQFLHSVTLLLIHVPKSGSEFICPAAEPLLHFTGSGSSLRSFFPDVNQRKQAGLLTSQRWKRREGYGEGGRRWLRAPQTWRQSKYRRIQNLDHMTVHTRLIQALRLVRQQFDVLLGYWCYREGCTKL